MVAVTVRTSVGCWLHPAVKEHHGQEQRPKGALVSKSTMSEKGPQGDLPSALTDIREATNYFFIGHASWLAGL